MSTKVYLLEASLRYHDGMQVFTAISGPVETLDELYLVVERDNQIIAFAELRLNMAFVTGVEPCALKQIAIDVVGSVDWHLDPEKLLRALPAPGKSWPNAVRGLIDIALHDATAREAGLSVVESLGGNFETEVPTNQCIFWCDDETLKQRVSGYVRRGFTDLKLRIGIESFSRDLERLQLVRELLPTHGRLSADVNGGWTAGDASRRLPELKELGLSYIEQPIAPGNWAALIELVESSPITIMLDEDLHCLDNVQKLLSLEGPVAAHLKIPKLGGIGPVLDAARILDGGDIPYMMGQMNEGGAATAAIVHCAMASRPLYRELYGADGLVSDPANGVRYEHGMVTVPREPGLGLTPVLDRARQVADWSL